MLSKVGSRVQRRSLRVASTADREQQPRLECAPELLRWSDFSTPFPPIAPGGYTKYYQNHPDSGSPQRPSFCPFLSHWPEPSSSPEPPVTSPLFFDTASSSKRHITIIQETPAELVAPRQTRTLSISTTTSTAPTTHSSLRRRRRRLLRTPSVERDFALRSRTLFSVDISVSTSGCSANSTSTPSLSRVSTSTHASSSDCHSSQFDSNNSCFECNRSAYHRSESESPISPATSVNSEGFDMLLGVEIDFDGDGDYERLKDSLVLNVKRPDSRTSFNTARSEFSDLEEP